ncbi:MAG: UvrD-helicase domain-containing protein, partial [Candidatus Cloacimonadota bacterium]|nr:UvrD-helicase domain-containing protein [Candidatus Cloacimonadota bacterium]
MKILKINSLDNKTTDYLKSVYYEILTHKDRLNVSTIDGFINSIFRSVIAPFHRINEYEIDNEINEQLLPEIYEELWKNFDVTHSILKIKKYQNLKKFNPLILKIISQRWLFKLAEDGFGKIIDCDFSEIENYIAKKRNHYFNNYKNRISETLLFLQNYYQNEAGEMRIIDGTKIFLKDFVELFSKYLDEDIKEISLQNFHTQFLEIFISQAFIDDGMKILFEKASYWSGRKKIFKEKKTIYEEAKQNLGNYLFYEKFLTEHLSLFAFAKTIYEKMDKIKFDREKKFTYDDITFHTFKFLYDKEFSIIDDGSVINYFYEKLTFNTRFLLIDEFQDTSIMQWKVIYPLIDELVINSANIKESSGVIIVGDEKQAIYGWRGGERDLLLKVPQMLNLGSNEIDNLNTSFRSEKIIIEHINNIFYFEAPILLNLTEKQRLDWKYQKVGSAKQQQNGYVESHFINIEKVDEESHISKEDVFVMAIDNLEKLYKSNKIKLSETAIICRKNSELEIASSLLRERNIEYILESSNSLLVFRTVEPVIFFLKFLYFDDILELIKFLRSDVILLESSKLKEFIQKIKESQKSESSNNYWEQIVQHFSHWELI